MYSLTRDAATWGGGALGSVTRPDPRTKEDPMLNPTIPPTSPATPATHPAADMFPPLEGAAFQELVADIRAHGLREPIVLHPDGRILDGRNRLRACAAAGIEPRYVTWDGQGTAEAFVVSLNLHRRHLSEAQRAVIADDLATREHGFNQHADAYPEASSLSQADAAALMGVSRCSVQRARVVKRKGVPELVEAVTSDTIPLQTAAKIAVLPPETQRQALAKHNKPDPPTKTDKTPTAAAITEQILEQFGDGSCCTVPTLAAGLRLSTPVVRDHVEALFNGVNPRVLVERARSGKEYAYRFVVGDGRMIDAGIVLQELNRRIEQADIPAAAEAAVAKLVKGLRTDVIERLAKATIPRNTVSGRAMPRRIA